MANEWRARLQGTMLGSFGIGGTGGGRIKWATSVLQARNAGDTEHVPFEMLTAKIKEAGANRYVVLQAPTLAGTITFTLPSTVGSTGQFLKTDGTGVLDWADSVANADLTQIEAFDEADDGTPIAFHTPPADALLIEYVVNVISPASAGAPTISVGITGDEDKYVDEAEVDLKTAGLYVIPVYYQEDGTPDPVIITVDADSQTFNGYVYGVYANPS